MAFSPNGLMNLTDFAPQSAMSSAGEGIWGITLDSYGCVWAAGDIVRGALHNGAYDWLGGFARFCSRDTTAPTTPDERQGGGQHPVVEALDRQLGRGAPVRGDPQRPRDRHHHPAAA